MTRTKHRFETTKVVTFIDAKSCRRQNEVASTKLFARCGPGGLAVYNELYSKKYFIPHRLIF